MSDTSKLKTLVQAEADKVFDELKHAKDKIGNTQNSVARKRARYEMPRHGVS